MDTTHAAEAQRLRDAGIRAAQQGDRAQARTLLEQAASLTMTDPFTFLWLATVLDAPAERRECLDHVLSIDPTNVAARRGLARLQGAAPPHVSAHDSPTPHPAAARSQPVARSGLPGWPLLAAVGLIALLLVGGVAVFLQRQPSAADASSSGAVITEQPVREPAGEPVSVRPTRVLPTPRPSPDGEALETLAATATMPQPSATPSVPAPTATAQSTVTPSGPPPTRTAGAPRSMPPLSQVPAAAQALAYGDERFAEQDYEGALIEYEAAVSQDSQSALAYHQRGLARFELGDYEGARADQAYASQLAPGFADPWHQLARALVLLGRYDEAFSSYSEALARDPGNVLSFVRRGNVQIYLGNQTGAMADYNSALAIDPLHSDALLNRARIFFEQEDIPHASADLYSMLSQKDNAQAQFNAAQFSYEVGDPESGLELVNRALDLDASVGDFYRLRGELEKQLGRRDRAMADLTQAVKLDPRLARAYALRASIYLERREYERAYADTQNATLVPSRDWYVYCVSGNVAFDRNRYEEAAGHYRTALNLNPSSVSCAISLGAAEGLLGHYQESIDAYTLAIQIEPNAARAYLQRGSIYKTLGNVEAARADYAKAGEIYQLMGLLDQYEEMQRRIEALQ